MKEIRYETYIENIKEEVGSKPSIFLAGPTVRGHQQHLQPSWRFEACDILKGIGFTGSVIIPEFTDITLADKGNEDWIVPWEFKGLCVADSILFWIPRTKELIGLNTNFEFGFWLRDPFQKVVYGRPDNSYRNKYLDIMYEAILNDKPLNSLNEACARSMKQAIDYNSLFDI